MSCSRSASGEQHWTSRRSRPKATQLPGEELTSSQQRDERTTDQPPILAGLLVVAGAPVARRQHKAEQPLQVPMYTGWRLAWEHVVEPVLGVVVGDRLPAGAQSASTWVDHPLQSTEDVPRPAARSASRIDAANPLRMYRFHIGPMSRRTNGPRSGFAVKW